MGRVTPKHLAKLPHAQAILKKTHLEKSKGTWSPGGQTYKDKNFSTSKLLAETEFQAVLP